ncbi:MAG: nucleotidyl transferase AbiEii/AbiGii toxin family protein, partial [Christensenellaceae bacterium]
DLILDWRVLGYGKDEPWEKRSNTKQDAFNKEANARAEVFLAEQFCPTIKAELSQELSCEANIYIDEKDKQTDPKQMDENPFPFSPFEVQSVFI